MELQVINLESGMPTVEMARTHMNHMLRMAKASRVKVVKLIHGYGSSGKGGAIRRDVHKTLQEKKAKGEIKAFVRGEDFSMFDADSRRIVDACPSMRKDIDYGRQNHGITVVLL